MRLGIVAPLAVALLSPTYVMSTAHAVETCMGLPVTVVGEPGNRSHGTAADDVVITNGASVFYGHGGDDTICVTPYASFPADVIAGPGDDRVDAAGFTEYLAVELGAGSDTFVGGPGWNYVTSGDQADARQGQPLGIDDITMGEGPGTAFIGSSNPSLANPDKVRMGGGLDTAIVRGRMPTLIDGGPGEDAFWPRNFRPGGDWRVNVRKGELSRDGTRFAFPTGISSWILGDLHPASLVFRGGPADDTVSSSGGRFTARMGGGADQINIGAGDLGPFDGGSGIDRLSVAATGATAAGGPRILADLATDKLRLTGSPLVRIPALENLRVFDAVATRVRGDDGDNEITVYGCGTFVRGRGGADLIRDEAGFYDPLHMSCLGDGLTAYGGPGDDVLGGGPFADLLVGDDGTDAADGADGADQCVAESVQNCES
jgi:Ca2+-binding RTX toxin-like protein